MSLKGSLQTVALPEVLDFLSGTGKSGELSVEGAGTTGRLWFDNGSLSGFDVAGSTDVVDALFQLLRIGEGEFGFTAGAAQPELDRPDPSQSQLAEALGQAQGRLAEWSEIVEVVPSLRHRVSLVADHPDDRVSMDRDSWSMVVGIAGGCTVADLLAARSLGEFEGCRKIKELVQSSLATVTEPADAEAPAATPGDTIAPAPAELDEADPPAVDFRGAWAASALESLGVASLRVSQFGLAESDATDSYEPPLVPTASTFDQPVADEPVFDEPVFEAAEREEAISGRPESDQPAEAELAAVPVDQEPRLPEEHAVPSVEATPVAEEDLFQPEVGGELHGFSGPDQGGFDKRAVLQALIDEASASPLTDPAGYDDAVPAQESYDGLADRGPWTRNELASFDTWKADYDQSVPAAESADDSEAQAQSGADGDEAEQAPVEEPINRGLLLKFLSSVRN